MAESLLKLGFLFAIDLTLTDSILIFFKFKMNPNSCIYLEVNYFS